MTFEQPDFRKSDMIFSRKVCEESQCSRAFGRPILSDIPEERISAEKEDASWLLMIIGFADEGHRNTENIG
jgi:hypothetical protein